MRARLIAPVLCAVLAALMGWLVAAAAPAQQPPPDAGDEEPAASTESAAPAEPASAAASGTEGAARPRVVAARSNDQEHPNQIGLGYVLTVTVADLDAYLAQSNAACERLTLFLHDIPIEGSSPDSCDAAAGQVRFTLVRTDDSAEAWRVLFTEPWEFVNPVSVSVGPKGRLPWPTEVEAVELVILPAFWVYVFFSGLAVAAVLFVHFARRSALLRDRGEGVAEGRQAPFSLARFQLAFWLFLVVAAYVFIWMITGELDTITGSVLALLGIGSATALGAAIIDQNKEPETAADDDAAPAGEGTPTTATPAPPPRPRKRVTTRGFLRDVLSDEQGISLYRFQLFIWTLVLGVIFCSSVYSTLEMPQFSPTLLGLMGISSGTYLGFKVPEQAAGRRE